MPDEIKSPSSNPPEGEPKPSADQQKTDTPTAEKPAIPGGVKATASGSVQSDTKAPAGAPPSSSSTVPPKPAAVAPAAPPANKPAAAAKAPVPTPVPWDSSMVAKLRSSYGSGIEALTYAGQNYMVVDRSMIPEILQVLRNEEQFDYCVDITAVHYPQREKQFEIIWILYSFSRNERIRVKTMIVGGEGLPSA